MDPLTATAAAALVMKYLLPAVKDLGAKILDKSETAAADATVGFGRRLLARLLPRRDTGEQPSVEVGLREQDVARRVHAVADRPGQDKPVIALETAVEDLLHADPGLLAAICELLAAAPKVAVRQGDRSGYVGGDNPGVIVTGDSNTVQR